MKTSIWELIVLVMIWWVLVVVLFIPAARTILGVW